MKLFLIEWASRECGLIEVVEELVKKGHKIVYWTAFNLEKQIDVKKFSDTLFHDTVDVLEICREGVDLNDFLPPSPNLLAKLYECESEILMMMNKRYEWMGVYERKRFYYSLVRYWYGILQKYMPDKIIFTAPPHAPFEFVIYHLAKLLRLPMIIFDNTWVIDRLAITGDYREGYTSLAEELKKNKDEYFGVGDLPDDLRVYYLRQTNPNVDSTPPSVNNFINRLAWKKTYRMRIKFLFDSIKNGEILPVLGKHIYKKFISNIKDEFLSVQYMGKLDFARPSIYVPLHYQPECTTSPLGGVFVDQLLMVETLSAALPPGWCLYVKENPQQWQPRGLNYFSYRYKGFYKALAAIPRVCLVPLDTSTYDLINASQAVATVTGTAGWEAILRNKTALIFGYPWYRHCYGILQVNDVDSVKDALRRVIDGYRPNADETVRYLYTLDKVAPRGFFEDYGRKLSPLSLEDNKKNILAALIQELGED